MLAQGLQRSVGQNKPRAFIELTRHEIAPLEQCPQDAHLRVAQQPTVRLAEIDVRRICDSRLLVHAQRHGARTIPRVDEQGGRIVDGRTAQQTRFLNEFISHAIIHVQQIVRVLPSVQQHFRGNGANSPVSELILLVHIHIAVVLEQVCETKTGHLENPRGLARVEQSDHVEAKVALKPQYVHVGTVQHLDNARIGKHFGQRVQVFAKGDAVDNKVVRPSAELHEARKAEE